MKHALALMDVGKCRKKPRFRRIEDTTRPQIAGKMINDGFDTFKIDFLVAFFPVERYQ